MARIVPAMISLASYRTVYGLVASYIRDPRLRVVLSFHPLLIGGNPFTTTSIYCLIAFLERKWGVHFAMGGTGRLVQGLVGLIERQGGEVRCGEEVTAIDVHERSGVRRPARLWRDDFGRYRHIQRGRRLDIPVSPAARDHGIAGATAVSSVRAIR